MQPYGPEACCVADRIFVNAGPAQRTASELGHRLTVHVELDSGVVPSLHCETIESACVDRASFIK